MSKPGLAARAAFACVLIGSASGCAYGEMRQVLRAQVATEAGCPDLVVHKASPYSAGYKANQYIVRGCGLERIYTCKPENEEGLVKFGNADCTYTKVGADAPAAPPAPPAGEPNNDDLSAPAADS